MEALKAGRDEAIKLVTQYAREAGEATGRLEMSEAPGVVDGWRERAEAAEARATALEERVRGLEAALEEARATFEEYARGHYAKQTPDGDAKALRNAKMAAKCVAALTESKAHV